MSFFPPPPRAILVYDGGCPLCRASVGWIRTRDARGAFEFLPYQSPDLAARFPHVSRAQCERAVTLVLPDGSLRSGAAALPHVLRRLPRWRWLAPMLAWPVFRPVAAWLYGRIARRRSRDIAPGESGWPE